MSLVRLNIKSRIELETRVLAAALKQSFESGDTEGASLAHRQLFALLKDVGRPPGDVGSILVADGMPNGYSDTSSTEEQMLIDAARATTRANAQNSDEKSQERQFGEQMTDWVAHHGHTDADAASEAEETMAADPAMGFESPSRQQDNPGSLAAKLYTQPLFSPYAGTEREDKEEETETQTPEPAFRPGFMRNSTRLQPSVRASGAKYAAIQPDAAAPKADEEATAPVEEPQVRGAGDDVELQKRTSENLPESDRRVDNGGSIFGGAADEEKTEQVDDVTAAPHAVPDHVPEQDANIAGVPEGNREISPPADADSEENAPGEETPAGDASAGAQAMSGRLADAGSESAENAEAAKRATVEAETVDAELAKASAAAVTKSHPTSSRTASGGGTKAATSPEATRATDFDAPMYQLLNVSQMAAFEEIHVKFLRRAKRVLAEIKANKAIRYEKLPELQKFWIAHDVLTDPVTRTDYDFRYLGVRGTQEAVEHPPEEQVSTRLSSRTPLRIGELLQAAHLLEPAELEIACDMHKAMPEVQFGTFLVRQGFIEEHHLEAALIGQKLLRAGAISVAQFQMAMDISDSQRKPIGDVLIHAAWITEADLDHALNPPPPDEPPPLTVQIRDVPLAKKTDAKTDLKPAWNDQLDWGPPDGPKTESGTGSEQKKSLGGFLASQQMSKPQISNKNAVPSWQDQIDWDQAPPTKESEAATEAPAAEAEAQAAKTSTQSEVAAITSESSAFEMNEGAPPVPPGVGFYAAAPDACAPPSPGLRLSNAVPTWKDQLDWGSPADAVAGFAPETGDQKSGSDWAKPSEIEIAPLSLEELQTNAAPVVGFGPSGSGAARTSPDDTATGLNPAVYTQPESSEPQPDVASSDAPGTPEGTAISSMPPPFGVADSRAMTIELSAAAAKQLRERAFGPNLGNPAEQTPAAQPPAGDVSAGRSTTGDLRPVMAASQDAGTSAAGEPEPAATAGSPASDRASTGELGDANVDAAKRAMTGDISDALKAAPSSQAETAAIPIQNIPKLAPMAPNAVPAHSDSRVPPNESILSYGKMARAFGADEDYSSTPKPSEGDSSASKPSHDAPQQGGFFTHLVKSAINAFRTTGNFPAHPVETSPPPPDDAAQTVAPHDETQAAAPDTVVAGADQNQGTAPDMVWEDADDEAVHEEHHDEDQASSTAGDDQKKPKKTTRDKRRKRK